jgi:CHAT domain-containing protein
MLHFAAHARVDEGHPDRSALLLAPGGSAEDGLLQSREILELRLEGTVVVLAACRTAGGSLLQGEGVLSLGRAFFQAGAPAVVASLWPLRDDHASLLLDSFYAQVAAGGSLGMALRAAQREAIGRGLPPSAWGALVVVGDGERVPFPGGVPRKASGLPQVVLAGLAALVALAAGASLWRRARRERPHTPP